MHAQHTPVDLGGSCSVENNLLHYVLSIPHTLGFGGLD